MEQTQRSRPQLHVQPPVSQRSRSSKPSTPKYQKQPSSEPSSTISGSAAPRLRRLKENQLSYGDSPAMENKETNGKSGSSSAAASPIVTPASPFLQNLINEQRAVRGSRPAPSEHTSSDSRPRTPTAASQSQSEISSEKQRKIASALSAGQKQPDNMGVREMDQYVHKLNKLNFDLKLDLYHRSQEIATLKKKSERMQELEEQVRQMEVLEEELQDLREVEENNQRLRESNEKLQSELDKRDQAVAEAVDMICGLEAKVEGLQSAGAASPASPIRPNSSDGLMSSPEGSPRPLTPRGKVFLDVPDRTSSRKGTRSALSRRSPTATRTQAHRQPSFIRDQNESTSALRSVYLADADKSRGALSTVSQTETIVSQDATQQRPGSPNLSMLSECSYFNPSPSPVKQQQRLHTRSQTPNNLLHSSSASKKPTTNSGLERSNTTLSRVEQWIQPREKQFEEQTSMHTPLKNQANGADRQPLGPAFRAERHAETSKLRTPTLDVPVFGNGRFPPTPDTMSTSHPNTRNGSNPSIVAEKSQYDRLYSPFPVNRLPRRPRSADEITTRPSTATTGDGLETMYDSPQHGFRVENDYPMANMFPSFVHADEANQTSDQPKSSGDAGHPDGKPVGEVKPTKGVASKSPPLTPQDWLDAALPTPVSKKNTTGSGSQAETPSKLPPPEHETASPDTHQVEEPELPPGGSLRVRVNENGSSTRAVSGARRLLNFRLFGRSGSVSRRQDTTPEPEDNNELPSPVTRISRRSSLSRRRSANHYISQPSERSQTHHEQPTTSEAGNGQSALRPFTPSHAPKGRGPSNRPCTAGSMDTATRSTSHGLFGWIRGMGAKDADTTTNTTPCSSAITSSPTPSHAAPIVAPKPTTKMQRTQQVTRRSESALAAHAHSDPPESSSSLGPDDGRKSKLPPRRFRRGKEFPGY